MASKLHNVVVKESTLEGSKVYVAKCTTEGCNFMDIATHPEAIERARKRHLISMRNAENPWHKR